MFWMATMRGRARLLLAVAVAACPVLAGATPQSDAAYQAALAAYNAKQYPEAIRQAEAAVTADPGLWQAWQVDGNARVALGDTTGAVTVYKYALRGNPNNPQLKAYVDQLSGAPAGGGAAAGGAADGQYQSALAKYNAGNYDGAMADAAAAVRADPNHWQAWQLLGNARYARGDKRGALEAYDKSLAVHPDNPQIKGFADSLRAQVAAQPSTPRSAVESPAAARGSAAGPKELVLTPTLSLGLGYAFANLTTQRDDLKTFADALALLGGSPTLASPAGLFQVNGAGEYPLGDMFGVLLRVGYDLPMTVKLDVGGSGISFKTSALLVTAGGYVRMGEVDGMRYGGSLSAGLIKVTSTYELDESGVSPLTESFGGSGLAIQVCGEAAYPVSDGLEAYLEVGYQIAKLSGLTATADNPDLGFKTGDALPDLITGQAAPFDMGGLIARVGLRFSL